MNTFSDLPHDRRMALRKAVEDVGGEVMGYTGDHVTVAVPQQTAAFFAAMRPTFTLGASCYFPLGTDKPDANLRHNGPGTAIAPHSDPPGYWMYAQLTPIIGDTE